MQTFWIERTRDGESFNLFVGETPVAHLSYHVDGLSHVTKTIKMFKDMAKVLGSPVKNFGE